MKEDEARMLCSWSFILGFTEGIPDRILNINIFKIFVGDSICEVKVKFSICMKFFRNPSKYYLRLFIPLVKE
jgi:hypothetical protein